MDLIAATPAGLGCAAGGFTIDPALPVERAILTHAHGDHAVAGVAAYLCARPGQALARARLGPAARVEGLDYGERVRLGDVAVSLHPAGHVLGSAQVRVERGGDVWVVSGDYKTHADPTCAPLEPLACRVFVSEATFALPIFRWPEPAQVLAEVHAWWRANQERGRASVLYAYALGKAQRLLALLDADVGPIAVHGAIARQAELYAAEGARLAPWVHASEADPKALRGRALVLAQPSARNTPWLKRFGPSSDGFASGWMRIRGARRRRALDRGFVLSDHADWDGLLATIEATGAERVLATHGYAEALARWLAERGRDSGVLATARRGEAGAEQEPGEAE